MNDRERSNWWQTFHKFQQSREKTWQPKINAAFKNQYKIAADYLKENGISETINQLPALVSYSSLAKIIQNIYIDAGTVFGGKAYQAVKKKGAEQKRLMPIGFNEELINEIIQYFQTSLLNQAVIPIAEKTRDYILKILSESQQNGVSIDDIVSKLITTDLSYERSRTIARTETVKAANYGAVQSVKKLGYNTLKIWISAADNRTRRIPRDTADHYHMNGVMVPMEEDFKVGDELTGFDLMSQPGDPRGGANQTINCRCTVGFKIL